MGHLRKGGESVILGQLEKWLRDSCNGSAGTGAEQGVPADVDHRWFVRGAKQVMVVIHRPRERRRQHEQWLKAGVECDLHFFTLAPRLTAHRLPRRLAFGPAVLPPLTQNSLEEDSTRPRKTSRQNGASITSRFRDGGGDQPRGWFFCRRKQSLFFEPPRGGSRSARVPEITPATIKSMIMGRDE